MEPAEAIPIARPRLLINSWPQHGYSEVGRPAHDRTGKPEIA